MSYQKPTQFRLVQEVAAGILQYFEDQYYSYELPIPVEIVAAGLYGLSIRRVNASYEEFHGMLSVEEKAIFVNTNINWTRKQFTIAHELGHWVLHSGKSTMRFGGLKSAPISEFMSSTKINKEKVRSAVQEQEANWFAAALLVPTELLVQKLAGKNKIKSETIFDLAKQFGVSPKVVMNKIKNLQEYRMWDAAWVDAALFEDIAEDIHIVNWKYNELTMPKVFDDFDLSKKLLMVNRMKDFEAWKTANGPVGSTIDFLPEASFGENELAEVGKQVGEYLRKGKKKKVTEIGTDVPYIFEFSGTPNSGKDTLINIVREYLTDVYGYHVKVIDEGIKECYAKNGKRLFKTIALSVANLYEAALENPGNYDFVLINRGIFDRISFLYATHLQDNITEEKMNVHIDYLLSYADLEDAVFLFMISPEESIQRETNTGTVRNVVEILAGDRDGRNHTEIDGMSYHASDMINSLNRGYWKSYKDYREYFHDKVYYFDYGNGKDPSVVDKANMVIDLTLLQGDDQMPFPGMIHAMVDTPEEKIDSQIVEVGVNGKMNGKKSVRANGTSPNHKTAAKVTQKDFIDLLQV